MKYCIFIKVSQNLTLEVWKWLLSKIHSIRYPGSRSWIKFLFFLLFFLFLAGDSGANQTPLWLGDDLEFWPEKSNAKERLRFVKIASLSTELIAVSEKGILYQWRWSDMTPHRHDNPNGNHPRSAGLGLTSEKVVKISASNIRYVFNLSFNLKSIEECNLTLQIQQYA